MDGRIQRPKLPASYVEAGLQTCLRLNWHDEVAKYKIDLRLAKSIRLGGNKRLQVMADIFNPTT